MVTVLIISAKIANPSLLKTKIFWKKSYDVITSVHDFAKKKLTCDSNCIAHVFMWPKFRNSSMSVREVIITSILKGFDEKNRFFGGIVLVQVQFGTGTRCELEILHQCGKRFESNSQKVLGANLYVCKSCSEKTGRGPFCTPPPPPLPASLFPE